MLMPKFENKAVAYKICKIFLTFKKKKINSGSIFFTLSQKEWNLHHDFYVFTNNFYKV